MGNGKINKLAHKNAYPEHTQNTGRLTSKENTLKTKEKKKKVIGMKILFVGGKKDFLLILPSPPSIAPSLSSTTTLPFLKVRLNLNICF